MYVGGVHCSVVYGVYVSMRARLCVMKSGAKYTHEIKY